MTSAPTPPPVVPIAAAHLAHLRGRRVVIGVPGIGFRADLRADDAVTEGGRSFVPVLTEQEYYRAELHGVEAFAVLVPIERVWVEEPGGPIADRLLPLDAPSPRPPGPVILGTPLLGRRLVQAVADGFVRDLRAVCDPYVAHSGGVCVRVCAESAWYAWALDGSTPPTVEVQANYLWIE
jgi:hypothetical protein